MRNLDERRQAACRELFRYELEPGLVGQFRQATNGNFVLGDERFAREIEAVVGRRAVTGKSGRPRKCAEPASEALLDGWQRGLCSAPGFQNRQKPG
mgnify:CR=1 FL=1